MTNQKASISASYFMHISSSATEPAPTEPVASKTPEVQTPVPTETPTETAEPKETVVPTSDATPVSDPGENNGDDVSAENTSATVTSPPATGSGAQTNSIYLSLAVVATLTICAIGIVSTKRT